MDGSATGSTSSGRSGLQMARLSYTPRIKRSHLFGIQIMANPRQDNVGSRFHSKVEWRDGGHHKGQCK